jgi:signal recognition particle GTPase
LQATSAMAINYNESILESKAGNQQTNDSRLSIKEKNKIVFGSGICNNQINFCYKEFDLMKKAVS